MNNESFKILDELRLDCSLKQKRGLHFIMASVLIWIAILIIQLTNWPIMTKNLFTFCCSTPLLPLALLFSRIIGVQFQNKENPLSNLGILFSLNQLAYLLIAMWAYAKAPNQMLMIYAMIFGAHLMPYGWLYQSKTYYTMTVIVSMTSLLVGLFFPGYILAIVMLCLEILFCLALVIENSRCKTKM